MPQKQYLPDGYVHVAYGNVGSTNTLCLEYAQQNGTGNVWITGERQLQGRGSRGRAWVSEPGNLYASLLLRDCGELKWLHTLTFVASLAIRDAILAIHGAPLKQIGLKWPNDVLIDDQKISGILLESHEIDGARYVIIGMGINIKHSPQSALFPATSLLEQGLQVETQTLFQLLADAMTRRLAQWSRGHGFDQIRQDWMTAAARLNEKITIKTTADATEGETGFFRGIDRNGSLLLEQDKGQTKTVSTADIFFA